MRKNAAAISATITVAILSLSRPAEAGAPPSTCNDLPFFARYDAAEALTLDQDLLELRLTADHHSADCGSSDGYGTHLLVRMKLRQDPGRCVVEDVTVARAPFTQHADDYRPEVDKTPIRFTLEEPTADIGDESLERLVFRSHEIREAIVLLPYNFFYFFDVEPDGVLNETLHPDGEGPECCWGANSSWFVRTPWRSSPQQSGQGSSVSSQ